MIIKGFSTQQHHQQQVQTTVFEENLSNLTYASGEQQQQTSVSSENRDQQQQPSSVKKKRNLPGNPDPEAEVISLSPKTLMARNRFVCEICNKGFQRDQNLQLHRRGHNLPWKLKQRSSKEVRKKVYICPEPSCVHHDPTRALGDLTGIKKHFSRKHGEKKWKCEKCSKKYAVQSDWKAHSKTCGTREYRCDCNTLFSRRDSFISHRAFCDALAEEASKTQSMTTLHSNTTTNNNQLYMIPHHFTPPPLLSPRSLPYSQQHFNGQFQHHHPLTFIKTEQQHVQQQQTMLFNESSNNNNNINGGLGPYYPQLTTPSSPHMSATALLQKAAQMGASMSQTTSNNINSNNIITAGHSTAFALNLSSSDQNQQNHQMGGNANLTYTLTENSSQPPPTLLPVSTTPSTLSAGHHFFHDIMMNPFQDHEFDHDDHESRTRNSTSTTHPHHHHHDENGETRDFLGLKLIISQSDQFLNIAGDHIGNCIDGDNGNDDHDCTFEVDQKSWQGY